MSLTSRGCGLAEKAEQDHRVSSSFRLTFECDPFLPAPALVQSGARRVKALLLVETVIHHGGEVGSRVSVCGRNSWRPAQHAQEDLENSR